MKKRILVVDDDRLIREMAGDALELEGFRVTKAASGHAALESFEANGAFDIVITDLSMREMDGLELTEEIKRRHPMTDVIVLTAYASLESALQAMRLGASDYLRKPVNAAEIVYGVKRTILRRRLMTENESLRAHIQAFEASRTLSACTETSDVLPLTLDIVLQIVGRSRGVGRFQHDDSSTSDGVYLRGFDGEEGFQLRQEIERGKLFDPSTLDPAMPGCSLGLQEALAREGLDDENMLALPLCAEGRVTGGIWVFSDGRPFEEDELRRVDLVMTQGELALINAERFLQAREKAFIDDVTDLYNARYLLAALDREVSRADRAGLEISVLFLDMDRFKNVNDRYGHLVGSQVLREFGQLLHQSVRSIDTVGRYGGDEFSILLVDTGIEEAMQVASRIREMTQNQPFGTERGLRLSLTVSIGVATFPLHGRSREELLDRADKAMYLGKSLGRNQVCSADELSIQGSDSNL